MRCGLDMIVYPINIDPTDHKQEFWSGQAGGKWWLFEFGLSKLSAIQEPP